MTDLSPRAPERVRGPVDEDELLAAVRSGDTGAYAELYRRHHAEALRLARRLGGPHECDDIAQEAFLKVLKTIMRGGGPQRGFVAYLMRAVRNEVIDRQRRAREVAVEDVETVDAESSSIPDGVDDRIEQDLVQRAFTTLPQSWQQVLWLTEVEGLPPRAVAPQLQQSPNAVSQLSRRAREGLRTAWLQAHVDATSVQEPCRQVAGSLGAYERGQLTAARASRVTAHLEGCVRCSLALSELRAVSTRLRGLLLPVVLGSPILLGSLSEVIALAGTGEALTAALDHAAGGGAGEGGAGGDGIGAATGGPTGAAPAADPSAGAFLSGGAGSASPIGGGAAGAAKGLSWLKLPLALQGWTMAIAGATAVAVVGGVLVGQLPREAEPDRSARTSASAPDEGSGAGGNLAAPAPTRLPEAVDPADATAPVHIPAPGQGGVASPGSLLESQSGAATEVGSATELSAPADPQGIEVEIQQPQPDRTLETPVPETAPGEAAPVETAAEPTEPSVVPSAPAGPEPAEPSADPVESEPVAPQPTEPPVHSAEPTEPELEPEPVPEPEPEPEPEPTDPEPEPEPTEPEPEPVPEPEPEPEPTEPPVDPEQPALEQPTVEAPIGGDRLFPVTLTGEGAPGALLRVLDADGVERGTTTVGDDGRWNLTPTPGDPDVATRYRAVQEMDGVTSAAAEPTDEYVFLAPTLRSPSPGATVRANSIRGGRVGAWIVLRIDVPERHELSVSYDGRTRDVDAPDEGTTAFHVAWLSRGTHTIELAYRDPGTGQLGAVRSATLTVR